MKTRKDSWIAIRMLAVCVFFAAGYAQEPARQLKFEVASVKPTPKSVQLQAPAGCHGGPGSPDPGRLECSNFPLKGLVFLAYGVQPYQVVGPDWIDSTSYDVVANVPAGVTRDQMKLMLRTLLEERLAVRVHRETRPMPAYFLVVAKNGSKMTVQEAPPPRPGFPTIGPGTSFGLKADGRIHVKGDRIPMSEFVRILALQLSLPVFDATELKGYYGFEMEFVPEEQRPAGDPAPLKEGPNLSAALQEQLGLRLEGRKAPGEVVVVDHADRIPIDN
jgi:uncharacterized protein (TIGR03435 family)